jgi:phospholipid/cholesterol/gamma-HCH transport system substrate-binding protein
MADRRRVYLRFVAVFAVLGTLGIAASVYILVHQRLPLPFGDRYTLHVELAAADGVVSGIGQPVNVVGVKVGQVLDAQLRDGHAVVTVAIDRSKLPRVYTDATAVLEPITPLKDMQIDLDPGSPPAPVLREGGTIPIGRSRTPVALSDVLSTLDADTRAFLQSLIVSLGQGTRGRGPDIRRVLLVLGPTTTTTGRIARAVAARRAALSRLVHNLAVVTRAAGSDHQLAAVVVAADRTLRAVADQDVRLRQAVRRLPPTLTVARSTLRDLGPFARTLGPAARSLEPAIRRLPPTLAALSRLADTGASTLARQIHPFVAAAAPVVRTLDPALDDLVRSTPYLSGTFQALEYLTNELAYNPPGDDEGFLFWLSWFAHNANSAASSSDANGGIGRATTLVTCNGLANLGRLQAVLGVAGLCPR